MRELGRRGGSRSPLTKLRKEADDGLREQAREVLSRALAGESVDKPQLDAARSLFAFRPSEAPRGREGPELQHPDRGAYTLQQLVEAAADVKVFSQSGWLDSATEAQMLAAVKASRGEGEGRADREHGLACPPPKKSHASHSGGAAARGDLACAGSVRVSTHARYVFEDGVSPPD